MSHAAHRQHDRPLQIDVFVHVADSCGQATKRWLRSNTNRQERRRAATVRRAGRRLVARAAATVVAHAASPCGHLDRLLPKHESTSHTSQRGKMDRPGRGEQAVAMLWRRVAAHTAATCSACGVADYLWPERVLSKNSTKEWTRTRTRHRAGVRRAWLGDVATWRHAQLWRL